MGTTITAGQRLRAKWNSGEAVFGLWAGIPTSLTAELGAAAGYDYVCVDLQHGLSDEATMVAMFQATQLGGAVPMARLAWNEPWLIMRALDLGAAGVILPLIGAGTWADRGVAVSCTGAGESFIRAGASRLLGALVAQGVALDQATSAVMREIAECDGVGGLIAVDAQGNVATPFSTAAMPRGTWREGGPAAVQIP